jgi:hypothetical protein
MDFFSLPAMNDIRITVDVLAIIVVVKEFMGNDLLSLSRAWVCVCVGVYV